MTEIEFIQQILNDVTPFVQEKYRIRANLEVMSKSNPNDLLTVADLAVQGHLVETIRARFPGDGIVAEERDLSFPVEAASCRFSIGSGKDAASTAERCWLIDPIDGTQNFVRGLFPAFGISVAFAIGGRSVAAGVMLPVINELFLAERGAGATRNGQPIRVSSVARMNVARLEVDFAEPHQRGVTLKRGERLICEAGQIRCGVSCVISLCSVACGEGDAYFHVGLSPWDYAAGILIVEEAGGKTSRLDNTDVNVLDGQHGLFATNGLLHDELRAMIAEV